MCVLVMVVVVVVGRFTILTGRGPLHINFEELDTVRGLALNATLISNCRCRGLDA